MPKLAVGQKAPDFTLPDSKGKKVSLKDFKGKKVVVYFYPKADTPGCTREAIAFTAAKKDFDKANTQVLGVSADSVEKQDKFCNKFSVTFPLLCDPEKKMLTDYDAYGEKSMYGKKFMGIIRSTVLVDEKGNVARLWPRVSVDGHAQAVLEAAKALK